MENKRINSKKLVLKVNLENGETRDLTFVLESRLKNQLTCPFCPYDGVCDKLPHPEHLNDKSISFADYCTEVEEMKRDETNTIVGGYVPQEGTIEENLSDVIDVNKILTEKKIYVPLDKVIDSICDGVCQLYEKDHSRCSSCNQMCILSDIFANTKNPEPDPVPVENGTDMGGVTEAIGIDSCAGLSSGPSSIGSASVMGFSTAGIN